MIYKLEYGPFQIIQHVTLVAFGTYYAVGGKKIKPEILAVMFVIGSVYIYLSQYMHVYIPITNKTWDERTWPAALYIIPVTCMIFPLKMHSKVLETLGRASYNIYIVQKVFYQFGTFFYRFTDKGINRLIIAFTSCITCGLIFYYIENRITSMLISFLNSKISDSFKMKKEKVESLICIEEPEEKSNHAKRKLSSGR